MTTPSKRQDAGELDEIRALAMPLARPEDLDSLLDGIGGARCVLLGGASLGTVEYYGWRAAITRRLISEHGFSFVAVEGDWLDCARVNRWVKDRADKRTTAEAVLGGFDRWPTWMWANHEVARFVAWQREHNRRTGGGVGFYGLDVYSLWDSLRAVFDYLDDNQPDALQAARDALHCFEPYHEDPVAYAHAGRGLVPASCEAEVVALLAEVRGVADLVEQGPEERFDAEQNAEVAAGAERYYRAMIRGDGESWNVREHHMADTLDRLMDRHGADAKAVVWGHNAHVGDGRATDMDDAGMVTVGQLARDRYDNEVVIIGFAGHRGSVVAAESWGGPMHRMPVPPAPADTHEDLLHQALGEPSLLLFPDDRTTPWLNTRRGHRAIGAVYRPSADSVGTWTPTIVGRRYDALVSIDTTHPIHPLRSKVRPPSHDTRPWAT